MVQALSTETCFKHMDKFYAQGQVLSTWKSF